MLADFSAKVHSDFMVIRRPASAQLDVAIPFARFASNGLNLGKLDDFIFGCYGVIH